MRATCVLAVSLMLICGTLSAANAANSDAITPQTDSQDSQQMGVEAPAPAERPADAANPEPEPAADAAPAAAPAQPAETAMPTPSSPPAEATSAPHAPPSSPAVEPTIVASGDLLYVPAARYLEANSRTLGNFDDADRKTLQQFYASRMGSTLWVTKTGYNDEAKNLIAAFKDADNWGLNADRLQGP